MPPFDPKRFQGMSMEDVLQIADRSVARGNEALLEARSIYKLCLEQKIGIYHKGVLAQKLWETERKLGQHALYMSEAGQDHFVHRHFFEGSRNGTFVEIGGYDGWMGSNCYFFEKVLGWSGVIVEPSRQFAERIADVRTAEVVQGAIADQDGTAGFLEITAGRTQMGGLASHFNRRAAEIVRQDARHAERRVSVPAWRLDTLLSARNIKRVDYCSIDVEGAERAVLSAVDFDAFDISVLSVENNSHDAAGSYGDILEPAGYRLVAVLGADEIWARTALADSAGF